MDFQKHYRMPAVYLMDPDRTLERKYNKQGWPFLILADDAGEIVYQCNNLADRDKEFMRQLRALAKTPRLTHIQTVGDIPYRRTTLEKNGESEKTLQHERFTSVACGTKGEVYTVYTAEEDGDSNVYLRTEQSGSDPNIMAAATTDADEYDGSVITDADGEGWLCWTSNSRGWTYNIYLNSLTRIRSGEQAILISGSKEDCMHGRMAADASGAIWVTYYKWLKMGDTSRDKEVYVRKYDGRTVGPEIHVSPEDVPNYEDHTDPAIAILKGQPVVCWSWDFHTPEGYTKDAETPTIFARLIGDQGPAGKAFDVSAKNTDMTPVLGRCGDVLWCAWDSSGPSKKSLCVRQISADAAKGETLFLAKNMVNVCSPCFAFANNGKGILTWCQTQNGKDWSLWKADYDAAQKAWGKPVEMVSKGNPRFGSCAYDSQGALWLAYSAQTDTGRRVLVRNSEELEKSQY